VARLEPTVGVVASQRLVHAGNECTDRTTFLGRVVVSVDPTDHQVLQLRANKTHKHQNATAPKMPLPAPFVLD